jgi:hypothetical protein
MYHLGKHVVTIAAICLMISDKKIGTTSDLVHEVTDPRMQGKALEDMIRMVEKSLRKVSIWGRRRKKCVVKKSSTAS